MSTRIVLYPKRIAAVASDRRVIDGLNPVAANIVDDVRRTVSGSRTIKPMGSRIVRSVTDRGVRVGTTWGPAVPVEYGTIDTPPQRVWLGAAERFGGKVRFR